MMIDKLLVATGNQGKLVEIAEIFAQAGLNIQLVSLADYPDYAAPEETGSTFGANAYIKAMAACEMSGLPCLADDSGLTVDALGGDPGVHSARYAGEEQDDKANRDKLLAALAHVPMDKRQAAFVCCAVLVYPQRDGSYGMILRQGDCQGVIALAEKGENGFGYDNLFYLPEQGKTMAEISMQEKNALSHRGKAMREMAKVLAQPLPESLSACEAQNGCCC